MVVCCLQATQLLFNSLTGLVAGMGMGAANEFVRRAVNPSDTQGSVLMSEANVSRLVDKLSRMRGAALKLGQFMSIQGMGC
jgi:aarF domain-containing kinase